MSMVQKLENSKKSNYKASCKYFDKVEKKKKKFCTLMHFEYICLYVQIAGRKVSKLSTLDIEMCIKRVYKHASQQLLR